MEREEKRLAHQGIRIAKKGVELFVLAAIGLVIGLVGGFLVWVWLQHINLGF